MDDSDPSRLLAALQLGDSFFPTGMYTQSHGLEQLVSEGLAGEAMLAPVVRTYLLHLAGPGDALAARWAAKAGRAGDLGLVRAVDERLEATKLSPEGRLASRRCGGRVLLLGAEVFGGEALRGYAAKVAAREAPGHQSVALGLCCASAGLGEEAAALVELHSFAVSLVSAAVRLGALEHGGAQRVLLAARPWIAEAAAIGRGRGWEEIGGLAPEIELAQMRHAYAEVRMFVS